MKVKANNKRIKLTRITSPDFSKVVEGFTFVTVYQESALHTPHRANCNCGLRNLCEGFRARRGDEVFGGIEDTDV